MKVFVISSLLAHAEGKLLPHPGCVPKFIYTKETKNQITGEIKIGESKTYEKGTAFECVEGFKLKNGTIAPPWCSTKIDSEGKHVKGGGHFKDCVEHNTCKRNGKRGCKIEKFAKFCPITCAEELKTLFKELFPHPDCVPKFIYTKETKNQITGEIKIGESKTYEKGTAFECVEGFKLKNGTIAPPWCSTKIDSEGKHVKGGGHFKDCVEHTRCKGSGDRCKKEKYAKYCPITCAAELKALFKVTCEGGNLGDPCQGGGCDGKDGLSCNTDSGLGVCSSGNCVAITCEGGNLGDPCHGGGCDGWWKDEDDFTCNTDSGLGVCISGNCVATLEPKRVSDQPRPKVSQCFIAEFKKFQKLVTEDSCWCTADLRKREADWGDLGQICKKNQWCFTDGKLHSPKRSRCSLKKESGVRTK